MHCQYLLVFIIYNLNSAIQNIDLPLDTAHQGGPKQDWAVDFPSYLASRVGAAVLQVVRPLRSDTVTETKRQAGVALSRQAILLGGLGQDQDKGQYQYQGIDTLLAGQPGSCVVLTQPALPAPLPVLAPHNLLLVLGLNQSQAHTRLALNLLKVSSNNHKLICKVYSTALHMQDLTESGVVYESQVYWDQDGRLAGVKQHYYLTVTHFLRRCLLL